MAFISVDSDGSMIVEDVFDQKTVISDIGGQWDSVSRVWRVTFTIGNLEHLMEKLEDVRLAADMEARVKEQEVKEAKLDKLREMSKIDLPVSLKVPGLKGSLYNYQRLGVMYTVTNGAGVLLADEMGLGKSIQSIATALFLKEKEGAKKVLVVTPASLKYNWPLEIAKFTNEKFVVIDGTSDERIAQWLRDDVFFYIVNYELLLEDLFGGREYKENPKDTAEKKAKKAQFRARAEMMRRLLTPVRNRKWDLIIADEVHNVKHPSSRRSRNLKQLRARFRIGLTGTPLDGKLEELHSVMEFVAPGLLASRARFYQRYIETDFFGKVTGYKRISEVSQKIQPFFIRRLKKDVLRDLPDKIYENRVVVFTAEEAKIYEQLASCGHKETENAMAMTALIRCKQFCNYPAYVDPSCKKSSKLDDFKEVVDELVVQNGHKILIFSQYKEMLNILTPALSKLGIKYLRIDGDTPKKDRAEMQAVFNTDKTIDAMVGTDAMSTGLNFTAADYVLNFDDFWSPAVMAQREDRAHRIGQRSVVTIVNFICRGTIEERIRCVLYAKAKISSQVLGDETEEVVLRRLGPKEMCRLL